MMSCTCEPSFWSEIASRTNLFVKAVCSGKRRSFLKAFHRLTGHVTDPPTLKTKFPPASVAHPHIRAKLTKASSTCHAGVQLLPKRKHSPTPSADSFLGPPFWTLLRWSSRSSARTACQIHTTTSHIEEAMHSAPRQTEVTDPSVEEDKHLPNRTKMKKPRKAAPCSMLLPAKLAYHWSEGAS